MGYRIYVTDQLNDNMVSTKDLFISVVVTNSNYIKTILFLDTGWRKV